MTSIPSAAHPILLETLPVQQRLALAYAPARLRDAWLALLALDARLATVVRSAREPVLGQLRLAWWRERLQSPAVQWPEGEPLLALLRAWDDRHGMLVSLVDGWENLLGEAPLESAAFAAFAAGRADAFAAMTDLSVSPDAREHAVGIARQWALADLLGHIGHPDERVIVAALLAQHRGSRTAMPKPMRPLAVLRACAVTRGGVIRNGAVSGLFAGIRAGIFGG